MYFSHTPRIIFERVRVQAEELGVVKGQEANSDHVPCGTVPLSPRKKIHHPRGKAIPPNQKNFGKKSESAQERL